MVCKAERVDKLKGLDVNFLDLVDHVVSVAMLQRCSCGMKIAIDYIYMNQCGCISKKFYLSTLKSAFCKLFTFHKLVFLNHLKICLINSNFAAKF